MASRSGGCARMSGPSRRTARSSSSSTGPFQSTASRSAPRRTSQGRPKSFEPLGRSCQRPDIRKWLRRTTPSSKRRSKFLPAASTPSSRRPSRRSTSRFTAARGCGVSTSTRSPTSACSRLAARARESPSGIALRPQDCAPRSREEAGLDEQRHRVALRDRLAVEALDCEALLQALAPDVRDQGEERRLGPALVGVAERDQRAPPALDEQGGLAAEQDDPGAGDAGGSRPRSLRPRQGGPVGLCRVGSRENEHVRLIAFARSELAQPFDCAAECELGAAEALDKVAAPAEAKRLERLQLAVDRPVATRNPLRAYTVAHDDSLPLEQQLRERPPIRTGPGTWSRDRAEEAFRSRPAALRRRDLAGPVAREAPRPPLRLRDPVAASGPQGLPGVVRDLAGPDEIPKRGQRLLGLEARLRQQVEPEQGVSVEGLAQAIEELAFGPIGGGHLPQHGCVVAEVDGDAVEAGADPDDLAGRAELVELRRRVAGNAPRQYLRPPKRHRQSEGP